MSDKFVFVGYRPTTMDGIEDYLEEPPVPGTHTTAEGKAKWRAEKLPGLMQALQYKAQFFKLTGRIESIFAVDPWRVGAARIFGVDADANQACAFIRWLKDGGHKLDAVSLVGFDIKQFVRVCGIEAELLGEYVPSAFWYQGVNDTTINPYEILVDNDNRSTLPLNAVLRLLRIEHPTDYQLHLDPKTDARIAAELAYRFHLVGDRNPKEFFADEVKKRDTAPLLPEKVKVVEEPAAT